MGLGIQGVAFMGRRRSHGASRLEDREVVAGGWGRVSAMAGWESTPAENPSRCAPLAFPHDSGQGDEVPRMAQKEKMIRFFITSGRWVILL